MNMSFFRKRFEHKQEYGIADAYVIAKIAAERSARQAKNNSIATWITVGLTMIGAIAAVIALFKS